MTEQGSPDPPEDHPSRAEVFGVAASPSGGAGKRKAASLDGTLPPYKRRSTGAQMTTAPDKCMYLKRTDTGRHACLKQQQGQCAGAGCWKGGAI